MTLPASRLQRLNGNKFKITLLKANVFKYNFKNVRFLFTSWEIPDKIKEK